MIDLVKNIDTEICCHIKEYNRRQLVPQKRKIELDDWSKGLLVGIISKAISSYKDLTPDDVEKLKEIKKQLQEI